MHTHFLRHGLLASAVVCAFAAAPLSQALAFEAAPTAQPDAMLAYQESDNQTVPGKVDDTWITTKVKTELATAKSIKATDISVETHDGVVTLTGTVPTKNAKDHAIAEVRAVKGVKRVLASGLTVGGE